MMISTTTKLTRQAVPQRGAITRDNIQSLSSGNARVFLLSMNDTGWRQFWVYDHCATGCQSRCNLPGNQQQREVPWCNNAGFHAPTGSCPLNRSRRTSLLRNWFAADPVLACRASASLALRFKHGWSSNFFPIKCHVCRPDLSALTASAVLRAGYRRVRA